MTERVKHSITVFNVILCFVSQPTQTSNCCSEIFNNINIQGIKLKIKTLTVKVLLASWDILRANAKTYEYPVCQAIFTKFQFSAY